MCSLADPQRTAARASDKKETGLALHGQVGYALERIQQKSVSWRGNPPTSLPTDCTDITNITPAFIRLIRVIRGQPGIGGSVQEMNRGQSEDIESQVFLGSTSDWLL